MSFFAEELLTESEVRQALEADFATIPWTNEARTRVNFVLECYKSHQSLSGFRFFQISKDEMKCHYRFAAMAGKNIIFEISFELKIESATDGEDFSV